MNIQLIVNSQRIELRDDVAFTFKKTNILFSFEKVECERTASFDIPVTPVNDRIFSYARIPNTDGLAMRRIFDSTLMFDGTTLVGKLYIVSYGKMAYKGLFICGDLLGLKRIKELGNICDIIDGDECVRLVTTGQRLPTAYSSTIWNNIHYLSDMFERPSWHLASVVNRVCTTNGIKPITLPSGMDKVRVISTDVQPIKDERNLTFSRTRIGYYTRATEALATVTDFDCSAKIRGVFSTQIKTAQYRRKFGYEPTYTAWHGGITHLVCGQDLSLVFPADFPENVYVGYISAEGSLLDSAVEFYGDRSFHNSGTIVREGEPLAGRSVDLKQGDIFTFFTESDYFFANETEGDWTHGWNITTNLSFDELAAEGKDVAINGLVRLKDNLPEITFTDLLKSIASMTGTMLNYNDEDGVMFDDLTDGWKTINVREISYYNSMERTFADYAQNNIVAFDSGDSVLETEKLKTTYIIDNENLDDEKELIKIPFNEGAERQSKGFPAIYAPVEEEKQTIASTDTAGDAMRRIVLIKNEKLQSLCDAACKCEVSVKMHLYEFEKITPKTLFTWHGCVWVWTESTWNNGKCKLSLSKFA